MTRTTLVSAFSRAALVTSLAFAAGCDTTVADAHVDLDAMNQAELPMERLMALADMTVFQVERGVELLLHAREVRLLLLQRVRLLLLLLHLLPLSSDHPSPHC